MYIFQVLILVQHEHRLPRHDVSCHATLRRVFWAQEAIDKRVVVPKVGRFLSFLFLVYQLYNNTQLNLFPQRQIHFTLLPTYTTSTSWPAHAPPPPPQSPASWTA